MRYAAAEKLEIIRLVACNGDIGIGFLYHEACLQESFA